MRVFVAALLVCALLAGCSGPAEPGPVAPLPPDPIRTDDPVTWSATMGTQVCTQTGGVSGCSNFGPALTDPLGSSDSDPTYLHDAKHRDLTGGQLTLTWDAVTPTTDALRLVVEVWDGCPDDCEVNRTLASTIGKSPLAMPLPAMPLGEDASLAVRVEIVNFAPDSQASIGQSFEVAGSLSFLEHPDDGPDGDETDERESDEDADDEDGPDAP